jgi:hypothetical protein
MTQLLTAKTWAAESDARIYALKRSGMNDLAKDLGLNPADFSSQVKLMVGIRKRIRDLLNGDGPVKVPALTPVERDQEREESEAAGDRVQQIGALLAQCTAEELRVVNRALRDAWNNVERKTAREWKVGDRVYFESAKRGRIEGKIEAILPKNVRVRQDGGFGLPWRVSPSLLRPLTK